MTQLITVEDHRRDEILSEAAQRQLHVVVSHRLDNGWVTYKSHILHADEVQRQFIIAQPMHTAQEPPPELVPGDKIGLTFRRGHKKCMCSVEIERFTTFELSDDSRVPALVIPWPSHIQEMQRRLYYRAAVPDGRRIEVRMWDGDVLDCGWDQLKNRPYHTGLLCDVSAGGCRVEVEANRNPHLEPGETICMQFQPDPRSAPIQLDAMFRHCESCGRGKVSLGFQFVGLETTPEGRQRLQMLSRVVSTFLRIELRRRNRRLHRGPDRLKYPR